MYITIAIIFGTIAAVAFAAVTIYSLRGRDSFKEIGWSLRKISTIAEHFGMYLVSLFVAILLGILWPVFVTAVVFFLAVFVILKLVDNSV